MIQNVQDEFEQQLRLILGEIAQEHGLDQKQLLGKYIFRGQKDLSPVTLQTYPVPEGLPVVPPVAQAPVAQEKKKGGRKPRFTTAPNLEGDLTEEFLKGLTIPLLKEACKMRRVAITGSKDTLIGRLLEYQKNPEAHQAPRKGGRKKKAAAPEPAHNHPLDQETHPDCEQCKTYGNPMDPHMREEVFEVTRDSTEAAPMEAPTEAPPVAQEPQEFEMDDGDIDEQLKAIVANMNQIEIGSDDEADVDAAEDPFGLVDYGEELDEED